MGDRYSVSRFNSNAPNTNTAQEITTNKTTNVFESEPAGSARILVRGFAASICRSATRLNAIAADRAETMHTTIQITCHFVGHPPAASIAPLSANGSAKMECSHLIISNVVWMLRTKGTERLYR